ncbi:uncharacterized protein BO95DRAFT_433772 [Aspergillus brunneoviolaceus CBS 621.78]|uniref:Uncharacterized protein n=1 Tax=Aspergillus brunneoviolaceus CBS 621.78 TaxID=1450534 RepID=A0ACD1G2R8_9EURO|nr:hypothetical protein BO95DRAFT_433772 [Aspergillus brunneoviolaceus CBS 621.78]RAH43559.1 hypothetical protein BO95DRAFT_433772 [Aspergillus brunneoviolaceus CBS 621.78]
MLMEPTRLLNATERWKKEIPAAIFPQARNKIIATTESEGGFQGPAIAVERKRQRYSTTTPQNELLCTKTPCSVMVQTLATGARLPVRTARFKGLQEPRTGSYLKGKAVKALHGRGFDTTVADMNRYVEMLESDRQRLIDGLQKLYRHTSGACPRDLLMLHPSGQEQPLIHEILSRLQVLPTESEDCDPHYHRSTTETTTELSATSTSNGDGSRESLGQDVIMSPQTLTGIDISVNDPLWPMPDSACTVQNQDLVTIPDATTDSKVLTLWEGWPMQVATDHLFSTTFSLDNGCIDATQWLPHSSITDWISLT